MASVMELFGRESEPVTARLVEVTLVALRLLNDVLAVTKISPATNCINEVPVTELAES